MWLLDALALGRENRIGEYFLWLWGWGGFAFIFYIGKCWIKLFLSLQEPNLFRQTISIVHFNLSGLGLVLVCHWGSCPVAEYLKHCVSGTCLQLWRHLVTPPRSRCSNGTENVVKQNVCGGAWTCSHGLYAWLVPPSDNSSENWFSKLKNVFFHDGMC